VSRRGRCLGGGVCVPAVRLRPAVPQRFRRGRRPRRPSPWFAARFCGKRRYRTALVRAGAVSLDSLCASWMCGRGYCDGDFGRHSVGDAALSVPFIYCTGLFVFKHKCCGLGIPNIYCSGTVVIERWRCGLEDGTLRAASPTKYRDRTHTVRTRRLTQNSAANQTRDVEDAVPYGNVAAAVYATAPQETPTATTTPAAPGDAPISSTTRGSDRSSTVLPVTTPTAVRAHQPSNLSL
jgi:hypothetical protein